MSGIFGQIVGRLAGVAGAGNVDQGAVQDALGALFAGQGGITGLVQQFEDNGFGEHIRSWIGTGENLPVTAEQLQQVLSGQQVQALAQKIGLPIDQLLPLLAGVLPRAVDQATPDGQVPDGAASAEGSN